MSINWNIVMAVFYIAVILAFVYWFKKESEDKNYEGVVFAKT